MKILVGLGNPSSKYEGTRHNVGFVVIDELAERWGIRVNTLRHRALCGSGFVGTEKVVLAKPVTYMNLSGEAVRPLTEYYKISPEDLLIICDDINLELGNLRVRARGSAGGHNGLKDIIAKLGTQDFPRLRVGVGGKPEQMELADYVLGHFTAEERKVVRETAGLAADAAETFVKEGVGEAMNRYNGLRKKEEHGSV